MQDSLKLKSKPVYSEVPRKDKAYVICRREPKTSDSGASGVESRMLKSIGRSWRKIVEGKTRLCFLLGGRMFDVPEIKEQQKQNSHELVTGFYTSKVDGDKNYLSS